MKSRIKKRKPKLATAVNRRDVVYKHFPINETKSVAVMGGRCKHCNKITTDVCSSCHKFYCEKHLDETVCSKCKNTDNKSQSYIG